MCLFLDGDDVVLNAPAPPPAAAAAADDDDDDDDDDDAPRGDDVGTDIAPFADADRAPFPSVDTAGLAEEEEADILLPALSTMWNALSYPPCKWYAATQRSILLL